MKDLPELVSSNVVSEEVANNIRAYYHSKKEHSSNKLLIVFGILGALLVGLGIILILAHNWDEIPRGLKVFFAFLPLVVGQLVCGYTLLKKPKSSALRESSTAFLVLAIGASISLVSQIYNIPGSINTFLLTWMLLSLPLVYIMKSSFGSLLYIVGITYYAGETSYWSYPAAESYLYWVLLIGILPHYIYLLRKKPDSGSISFHNWVIPISIIAMLGTIISSHGELLYTTYFSLFGLLYVLGNFDFLTKRKLRNNGFKILGAFGQLVLLIILSFDGFSRTILRSELMTGEIFNSVEFVTTIVISIVAIVIILIQQKGKAIKSFDPLALTFIAAIAIFLMGLVSPNAYILSNVLILIIGVFTIRKGAKQDHLGVLNYGLLIVSTLIICRFFDTNINFIVKGLLFVLLGVGFFFANFVIIKKRKSNEKK